MSYTNQQEGHIVNTCTKALLAAALLGLGGGGIAAEEKKHVIIGVAGDGAGDNVAITLNSDELGFDLDDMQVGETRSVVDEQGRSILVTRNSSGFSFNVDGETIELPDFAELDSDDFHWVAEGGEADINLQVIRQHGNATVAQPGGTVVVSREPIDEATRMSIRSILESAGHGNDVEFVDHEGPHEGRVFVKKIEKVVKVDQ